MSIDYTKIQQDEVFQELVTLMKKTPTFRNADFGGTALYDLTNNMSYVASLYGFYLNQIANEPFIDSAKQYKNINRIASSLLYNPVGKGSAKVPVASKLSKDYVLKNSEGFIEIPAYSLFPTTTRNDAGDNVGFSNLTPLNVQIKQFGVSKVKDIDLKYIGNVFGGTLDAGTLVLDASNKHPVHFVTPSETVITFESPITSIADPSLTNFNVGGTYSLFIRQVGSGYSLVVGDLTAEVLEEEVARFKVNSRREITFVTNFSNNKLYIGRMGFRNLRYTQITSIPYPGDPTSVGKIQITIPKNAPPLQMLLNGETYSFSNPDRDTVIASDQIESSFFSDKTDTYVIMNLSDTTREDYGAKLVLKKSTDLLDSDPIIAVVPSTASISETGNLSLDSNPFELGETKSGVIQFEEDEFEKRVSFEQPYNFGSSDLEITSTDKETYSVILHANDNVRTFYAQKTRSGFKIHIEPGVTFSGPIFWRCVQYRKAAVQSQLIDSQSYVQGINASNYSLILQTGINADIWVREVNDDNFIIDTDIGFFGPVDFLVLEDNDFTKAPEPKETGSVYIPKNEIQQKIKFSATRDNANYQVFLQPDDNVNVWFSDKNTDGFVINIESQTDFYGRVDWQVYESDRSGTFFFSGASGFYAEPQVDFIDLPETTHLGDVHQGGGVISLVNDAGLISATVNSLGLDYNIDEDLFPGVSFELKNRNVSYRYIRVFVEDPITKTWMQYTQADDYRREIGPSSPVFYVRVNKDKNIDLRFGDNDSRGKSVLGYNIAIVGLETLGGDGNIAEDALSGEILSSLNFQVFEIVSTDVFANLLGILRIKESAFYAGVSPGIVDYKSNKVTAADISVVQLDKGTGGTEPEGVEDIRANAQFAYRSQNRIVTKEDYEKAVLGNFSDVVTSVEVFDYKEIGTTGLFDLGDMPSNYFNTLFFLMVPTFGRGFTFLQRKAVKEFLDNKTQKIMSLDSIILEPTFVEIDVIILYEVKKNESPILARNDILSSVYEFFDRSNRNLGETITIDDIRDALGSDILSSLEIQLKRDDVDAFNAADYDVDITPDQYEDAFEAAAQKKLDDVVKKELRNLIGKGLIELKQPLFDIQKPSGEREWVFINDVPLGKFEFPVIGDVVIEQKT